MCPNLAESNDPHWLGKLLEDDISVGEADGIADRYVTQHSNFTPYYHRSPIASFSCWLSTSLPSQFGAADTIFRLKISKLSLEAVSNRDTHLTRTSID